MPVCVQGRGGGDAATVENPVRLSNRSHLLFEEMQT